MFNADSGQVIKFFELMALKGKFNIKNYYGLLSKVMAKKNCQFTILCSILESLNQLNVRAPTAHPSTVVHLNPGVDPSEIGWCPGKTVLLQIYRSRTLNKSSFCTVIIAILGLQV